MTVAEPERAETLSAGRGLGMSIGGSAGNNYPTPTRPAP